MKTIILLLIFSSPLYYVNFSKENLYLSFEESNDLQQVMILNHLAENNIPTNPDSALHFAMNALELAKQIDNDTLAANSSYLIGRIYILKESYDKAEKYSKYSIKIYERNNNIKNYMLSLIDMGIISYNLAKFQTALSYYRKLLSISRMIEDKEWYAIALDGIGTTHSFMANYDIAIDYLDSSLAEYKKLNMENTKARIYYGIGAVYMTQAKYDKALDYLIKAIKISEDKRQWDYLAMSNHAIGVIYEKLKNYSIAIKYDKKALLLANQINDKYLIGSFLNHTGEIYLYLSKFDTALAIANDVLTVQKEISNKVGIAQAFDLKGSVYLEKRQYNEAKINFEKALNIIKQIDQKYWQTKIKIHLGVVYEKIGKYKKALAYLKDSFNTAKLIGAKALVKDNLLALSFYYSKLGNHLTSYKYLSDYTRLNDSIFTTSSHQIAEMQMRYETGKREKENQLLKRELEIQQLELETSNLRNWISYLSLAIISIIGFFSYNRYKVKKKANILLENKIQDAIKKHQKQQEIIFHQANLSSLGELAAGMAHEINQPLQAIKLSTESLDLEFRELKIESSSIKENILEIYQGIERGRNIIDHVRVFAGHQKNHVDEFFDPSTVVEKAISLIGKQYHKKDISFKLKLNKRIGKIRGNPYKYEQIVFNLISNAKDALIEKEEKLNQFYEKFIDIKIFREKNDLVLMISDNGIGMSKEQKDNIFSPFFTTKNLGEGTGLGLSIVFGLVNEMGGRILVSSDYHAGTSVKVCIPKVIKKRTKVVRK